MKYDKLIKQTIDNFCKLFNITREGYSKKLNEVSPKIIVGGKQMSLEDFKKQYEIHDISIYTSPEKTEIIMACNKNNIAIKQESEVI